MYIIPLSPLSHSLLNLPNWCDDRREERYWKLIFSLGAYLSIHLCLLPIYVGKFISLPAQGFKLTVGMHGCHSLGECASEISWQLINCVSKPFCPISSLGGCLRGTLTSCTILPAGSCLLLKSYTTPSPIPFKLY